jgi:itaconyl-CoA hydratase
MIFSAYLMVQPQRYRERFGLCFEEFAQGQRFRHRPGITFSQEENANEALDTLNAAMLHYDAHYAAQTAWERPLMVSTLTLQRAIGMASKTFGRIKRITRFDEISMSAPVFGGDTLYSESEVLDATACSDPQVGDVGISTRIVKADGSVVGKLRYRADIYRRGQGPEGTDGEVATEARFSAYREDVDGVLVEQAGLFFDDFVVGETFVHTPRRGFSREEALEHARRALDFLSGGFGRLDPHQDGRCQMPETFVISVAAALTTRTFGRVVANLGWYDVELSAPAYPGDIVQAESTVLETRPSRSRPGEGVLTIETRLFNQTGTLLLSYRRKLLVYRREHDPPYRRAGY